MKRKAGVRHLVFLGVLVVALALAACSRGAPAASGALPPVEARIYTVDPESVRVGSAPRQGMPAPDVAFVDAEGTVYRLSSLRGHPVVLNFWATWCPPCRAEMPALAAAYRAHKDAGLRFFAVNEMEDRARVEAFLQAMNLSVPVILDAQGRVGRSYQVMGLPTTFFIDADGRVAVRWTGMLREEDIQRNLAQILPR